VTQSIFSAGMAVPLGGRCPHWDWEGMGREGKGREDGMRAATIRSGVIAGLRGGVVIATRSLLLMAVTGAGLWCR
jgi:hypothetical protein